MSDEHFRSNDGAVIQLKSGYECTTRWGIINPWGGVWTPETFSTADEARAHLSRFWSGAKHDTSKFAIEKVRVVVCRILD